MGYLQNRDHEILVTTYPKDREGRNSTEKYYYSRDNMYSNLTLGKLYRVRVPEFVLFLYNDLLKENNGELDLMRLTEFSLTEGDMLMFVGWHREATGRSDYPVFLYDGELLEVTGLPDKMYKLTYPLELVE